MRIHEVLDAQASGARRTVVTITADAAVRDLVELLAAHNIGAVVVRDSDTGPVAGIVSERDVVRRLRDGAGVLDGPVSAIMTSTVQTCGASDSVDEVMATMTEYRVRHVPVLDGGSLVGIISIGDVVKSRIGQLEFERDQLDSYLRQS
ncbi:CBS domain-containing protein [Nocardioides sp. CFH 31398]|uniref:CBS domain-containing protein n=1 Tax=Nocardioides sp. CFH 31398 TaxID=2919579 RepID=UPI001F0692FD|nr:CBS domain-containing protein [Nocardioides sp. CFH 31398]MCH1866595.1 CBS domain-containing protein [Nocardioides sp. CFH 31398]